MVLTEVFAYNQHFVIMMNIINAARLNPPKNGHKHHIIPRCWFKMNNLEIDNSKDNLVLLSIEDHIKVHKLAYKCALTNEFKIKMACAYHKLTKGEIVENKCFTGRVSPNKGKKLTDEVKNKLSISIRKHFSTIKRKATKGTTGMHWYNNGVDCILSFTCPEGWSKGYIKYKRWG